MRRLYCLHVTGADGVQLSIIVDAPEMQSQLVSAHGMLAIMEVLESRASRDVTLKLLQIVLAVSY